MKCFEGLVLQCIKTALPGRFDPHQFAYRANRSTEDAIALALNVALSHLEHSGNCVRMLFIDYSSAFNTVVPDLLMEKMLKLNLPTSLCSWIKDFLVDRPQVVKLGKHISSQLVVSIWVPQGYVLSPLLYSLYTCDCTPCFSTNILIKFADGTIIVGSFTRGDKKYYREEVANLVEWCGANNLSLNTGKTKELIHYFRKSETDMVQLNIRGELVQRVSVFKFLGINNS